MLAKQTQIMQEEKIKVRKVKNFEEESRKPIIKIIDQ